MVWYLLLIAVLAVVYLVFVTPFAYWSTRGVRQYHFWQIWTRNISEFLRQPPLTDAMRHLYSDFADDRYVGTYQLFVPKLCIKDPELIKSIFVKDFDHFVDHTMFIPTDGDPVWEKSLFSLRGEEWRRKRAMASPSFTSSKMKFMFQLMVECAEQFMKHFEAHTEQLLILEMKDTFGRITNDVFASTHFGVVCDSLNERSNEMFLMGQRGANFGGFWIKVRFVLIQMIPRITKMLGLKVFDQRVTKFFRKLIEGNIQYRRQNRIIRPDLIHLLMEATNINATTDLRISEKIVEQRNTKRAQLTAEDVTALVIAFFGGGYDSISSALCFAAYELALQPDIQKKLQREVDSTLRQCNDKIGYEELMQMKYMDMVVSETLRKWPGGFFLDRRCVKPYTIKPVRPNEVPVHLKEGDSIWLSIFVMHRDPKFYPDPEKFIPERFSDENKSIINPYVYVPFGIGPRHCIGIRFAQMEMKLVLLHILSKYSFEIVKKSPVPLRLARRNFQLASKDGFWLGLRRRVNE